MPRNRKCARKSVVDEGSGNRMRSRTRDEGKKNTGQGKGRGIFFAVPDRNL